MTKSASSGAVRLEFYVRAVAQETAPVIAEQVLAEVVPVIDKLVEERSLASTCQPSMRSLIGQQRAAEPPLAAQRPNHTKAPSTRKRRPRAEN
jgi:hypothetical protein